MEKQVASNLSSFDPTIDVKKRNRFRKNFMDMDFVDEIYGTK